MSKFVLFMCLLVAGSKIFAQQPDSVSSGKVQYSKDELIVYGDSTLRSWLASDVTYNLMTPDPERSSAKWLFDTIVELSIYERANGRTAKHENRWKQQLLKNIQIITVPFTAQFSYRLHAPGHPGYTSPCEIVLEFDSAGVKGTANGLAGQGISTDRIPFSFRNGVLATDFKNYKTATSEAIPYAEAILMSNIPEAVVKKSFHLQQGEIHFFSDGSEQWHRKPYTGTRISGAFFCNDAGDSICIPASYSFEYVIDPCGYDSCRIFWKFELDKNFHLIDDRAFAKFLRQLPEFAKEGKPPQFITCTEALQIARAHGLPETIENGQYTKRFCWDSYSNCYVWDVISIEKIEKFQRELCTWWRGKHAHIDAITGRWIQMYPYTYQSGCITPN